MVQNPSVPGRRTLTAAFLLLTALSVPALAWVGAHLLQHHEHHDETAELAEILVHGHRHQDGVPDHEHELVPAAPVRPEAPRDLQAPAAAALETPENGSLPLAGARPWRGRIRPPGSGPPLLQLLCVLLI